MVDSARLAQPCLVNFLIGTVVVTPEWLVFLRISIPELKLHGEVELVFSDIEDTRLLLQVYEPLRRTVYFGLTEISTDEEHNEGVEDDFDQVNQTVFLFLLSDLIDQFLLSLLHLLRRHFCLLLNLSVLIILLDFGLDRFSHRFDYGLV